MFSPDIYFRKSRKVDKLKLLWCKMEKKQILKTNVFSVLIPSGWIADTNQQPLAIYREKGDSGVVQISIFSATNPLNESKIKPEDSLKRYLKGQTKEKIKIKTYGRKGCKFALSDFYKSKNNSKDWFCRTMNAMTEKKMALITYNIEYEFKNSELKDVEEIFDSFIFE